MRVIAGKYKGRVLKMPKSADVRPTQDRIKESMFEILKTCIADADVLELFAGSGSLGIEALSRGAKSVVFVEREDKCIDIINENLDKLHVDTGADVIKSDAFRAIRNFSEQGARFGVVIADPPYRAEYIIRKLLIKFNMYDILKPPFIVVIEHSKKDHIPQKEGNIILLKQYNYGDTILSVYRKNI